MGETAKKFGLETYGKIMNGALEAASVQVLIEMPEGTLETKVTDNLDMGSVVQFYAMLNAIKPVFEKLRSEVALQLCDEEWEKVIDGMLAMVKDEIMEVKG